MKIRRSSERGVADHGWLRSRHTFSFADYYDPQQMGFRTLRVINEDRVQGGKGFGTHPHRDMEIISYVVDGGLQHRDSMGTGSVIRPGEVQLMSAGTGVTHSEFNASGTDEVHFLQIWIRPDRVGYAPRYAQRQFDLEERRNRLRLVVSPDGAHNSLPIRQHAWIWTTTLDLGTRLQHALPDDRGAWIQVIRGSVRVAEHELLAGDGASVESLPILDLEALESDTELLLFELR